MTGSISPIWCLVLNDNPTHLQLVKLATTDHEIKALYCYKAVKKDSSHSLIVIYVRFEKPKYGDRVQYWCRKHGLILMDKCPKQHGMFVSGEYDFKRLLKAYNKNGLRVSVSAPPHNPDIENKNEKSVSNNELETNN